ncbi:MAG: 3D domain-containing protein [Vulcanimicrobiaceae bacterium]
MNVSSRRGATVAAACTLALSIFGICADAGQAAPQAARSAMQKPFALHAQPHRAKHAAKRNTASSSRGLHMIATAYIAGCDGCSGITRTGTRAGHGVVAVDPHFIPLGTKLYVPGYGRALAGDTGGGIQGRRIDLGFDSLREAQLFGRREIVVYVLRGQREPRRELTAERGTLRRK